MASYRCGKCGEISTYREIKDFAQMKKEENVGENVDRGFRCPHCLGRLLFKIRAPVVRRVRAI